MSMAEGIEVRVPLLDPDLVELAARLPTQYKQNGREGKWIFKKAMEGILPNDIIYRPKTGFGAPIRNWIHGPLKTLVWDILSETSINKRKWFDAKAVTQLLKEDMAGKTDASYSIFALLCIELWARIFLDEDIVNN
jgi:asparagine synthase (glutamine-hydrolysing)